MAAVVTFDATNWWQLVTVTLKADANFVLAAGRSIRKTFAKQPHLLTNIQGPLSVEGGPTTADRSLKAAIKLPGERDGSLFGVAVQQPGVHADRRAQRLRRLEPREQGRHRQRHRHQRLRHGRRPQLPEHRASASRPRSPAASATARSRSARAAQINQDGATSTIEVLNILLGEGNDTVTVTSTLVPAAELANNAARATKANHGGLTTLHGGGNSLLSVTGNFTAAPGQLTRTDGLSWSAAGFATDQTVSLGGTHLHDRRLRQHRRRARRRHPAPRRTWPPAATRPRRSSSATRRAAAWPAPAAC